MVQFTNISCSLVNFVLGPSLFFLLRKGVLRLF
jgi:hypothetical protein